MKTVIRKFSLKAICNEKEGGPGKWQMSRTVAIEVCLSFNLVVIFNFNVFPFPPSKAKSIGDVPMNRENAANCRQPF
jgi:hypothetical protein